MKDKPHYISFLLRVWLAGDANEPQWRMSLEDTRSGERIGFGSLEAMCAYLQQWMVKGTDRPRDNEER